MLETQKRDEKIEKEKFYEGAMWAAKQAVNECDAGMDKIRALKKEYL